MSTLLTVYVLLWPALVLIIMVVIALAFSRDVRQARREGRPLI